MGAGRIGELLIETVGGWGGGGGGELLIKTDIKQQKVDNQETVQALLLVYNKPV